MALYEVAVRQVSTVYYEVEALSEDAAAEKFSRDNFASEFVESEEVIRVTAYDNRFDDDLLIDDYEIEQEDTDE